MGSGCGRMPSRGGRADPGSIGLSLLSLRWQAGTAAMSQCAGPDRRVVPLRRLLLARGAVTARPGAVAARPEGLLLRLGPGRLSMTGSQDARAEARWRVPQIPAQIFEPWRLTIQVRIIENEATCRGGPS